MVNVIKATGVQEPFSQEKVLTSIRRAGIPEQLDNQVLDHVTSKLYENIPTREIYHHITEFLGNSSSPYTKARYSLKQAIMELGPTGYPFEDYVAKLLEYQGYKTKVRQILSGKCVSHEIDVLAEKYTDDELSPGMPTHRVIVEAKFHHMPGVKTDIQVALYTKARFEDVKIRNDVNHIFLITNTKASQEAIDYGHCVGMHIIGWSYPNGGSFRELVEKAHLIPLTALTNLSTAHKQVLLTNHIVLCKEIVDDPRVLETLDIPHDLKQKVHHEAQFLVHGHNQG